MLIAAAEFKSRCLQLMDQIQQKQEEIIITKRGKPIAKLVPYREGPRASLFGYLKDSVIISGDIVEPTGEEWEVERD